MAKKVHQLPLIERKSKLERIIATVKDGIEFNNHIVVMVTRSTVTPPHLVTKALSRNEKTSRMKAEGRGVG